MSTIWDAIGNRFELFLQARFPELQKVDGHKDRRMPDFRHRENGFFVESKTGFEDYGVQIKQYQVESFGRIRGWPVVYAIGFHDFERARDRLMDLTAEERQRILDANMGISRAYFVSGRIIAGIWKKEHRVSAKEGRIYCTLKERFLSALINGSSFRRGSVLASAWQHYGSNPRNYLLVSPVRNGGDIPYGHILHKKLDGQVIDYLKSQNVLTSRQR